MKVWPKSDHVWVKKQVHKISFFKRKIITTSSRSLFSCLKVMTFLLLLFFSFDLKKLSAFFGCGKKFFHFVYREKKTNKTENLPKIACNVRWSSIRIVSMMMMMIRQNLFWLFEHHEHDECQCRIVDTKWMTVVTGIIIIL